MCPALDTRAMRDEGAVSCVPTRCLHPAGVDDVAAAMNVLEATNWQLEEAINLQFATGGDVGGAGGAAGGGGGGGAALPPLDEEEVRAPMPAMRDRLYGDVGMMHGIPAAGRGVAR